MEKIFLREGHLRKEIIDPEMKSDFVLKSYPHVGHCGRKLGSHESCFLFFKNAIRAVFLHSQICYTLI